MRRRQLNLYSDLIFILAVAVASIAASCPPKSAKQVSVQSLQVSEAALEGAQTIERSLCFNTPATEGGTTCTNPVAQTVGLTRVVGDPDAPGQMIPVHQLISRYFVKAFQYEILAAQAMIAWKPGDVPPTSVADYQREVQQLLMLAQTLLQGPQAQPLAAKLQAAVIK